MRSAVIVLLALLFAFANAIQVTNLLVTSQPGSPSLIVVQASNDPGDTNTIESSLFLELPTPLEGEWTNPDCQLIEDTKDNGLYGPVTRSRETKVNVINSTPSIKALFNLTVAPLVSDFEILCIIDAPEKIESVSEKKLAAKFDFSGQGGSVTRSVEKFRFEFLESPKFASNFWLKSSNSLDEAGHGLWSLMTSPHIPKSGSSVTTIVFSGANVDYIPLGTSAPQCSLTSVLVSARTKSKLVRQATITPEFDQGWMRIALTDDLRRKLGLSAGLHGEAEEAMYLSCPTVTAVAGPPGVFGFVGVHLEDSVRSTKPEVLSANYGVLEFNAGDASTSVPEPTPENVVRAEEKEKEEKEDTFSANINANGRSTINPGRQPPSSVSPQPPSNSGNVVSGSETSRLSPYPHPTGRVSTSSSSRAQPPSALWTSIPIINPSQHYLTAFILVSISILAALVLEIWSQ